MLNIGLVRGGEAGEELVFLPKGAQVVPINNNVSGVAEVHITIDSSTMDSLAKSQDHRMTITRWVDSGSNWLMGELDFNNRR